MTTGRTALASQQYHTLGLKSRLETAGPHGLVTILYDELLAAIDVIERAVDRGTIEATHLHYNRALSILSALEAGIDFEVGGSLPDALAGVYRAMRKELIAAVAQRNTKRIIILREGAASVSSAWNTLSA